jgi:hypothetical protein
MAVKLQLTISDEAWKVIEDAATERKRGEWLSDAIIDYRRITEGIVDPAPDAGVLESVDQRLGRLEKMVALLVQRGEGAGTMPG